MKVVHCKRSPYDIYIGRGKDPRTGAPDLGWGNPFVIGRDGNRDEVVAKYRAWIESQPNLIRRAKLELRGKTLGCWCAPQACHGDVLIKIANS
jgi:hypothetical protein